MFFRITLREVNMKRKPGCLPWRKTVND